MTDVISDYQKWKEQGEHLRAQAKQAMEARFRELLAEAVQIAEEYRSDFGTALKVPPGVTAFRFKSSGKVKRAGRAKASAKPAAKAVRAPARVEPPPKPDRKVAGMQKRLAAAKKKLDEAKAAGGPTRVLEDRIYEIEDELRLAAQTQ